MATEPVAMFIDGTLTANLIVSTVAIVLGVFAATSPDRAAEIWGSQRFHRLAPERRPSFVRWYRVFGIHTSEP